MAHRDADVRLLVACCLADILRLFAPRAPYPDEVLQDVFSLCIKQFRGLERGEHGPNFVRHFYLLERLSLVNSFIIILDLPVHICEKLIADAFSCFFSISRVLPRAEDGELTASSTKVQQHMVEIMSLCVSKSDSVPDVVIESLLENLILGQSAEGEASKAMSADVIRKCRQQLQGPITKFLNSVLYDGGSQVSDLGQRCDEIIMALNEVEPQTLQYVMPNMISQLKVR